MSLTKGFAHNSALVAALIALVALASGTGPAWAQMGIDGILPEVIVRGQGWTQIRDPQEIYDFALSLVESTLMTAAIAYHPLIIARRTKQLQHDAPQTMFTFSLIGMVVGFLIMHHGYLIGFVLFGLGGLLRFRTTEASGDTTRLILVTLIGLCVGLDLPVIALVTTASSVALIYIFGRSIKIGMEVKFNEDRQTMEAMRGLRDTLAKRGLQTVSMSKTKFKPQVELVIAMKPGLRRSDLEREMAELAAAKKCAIADWHIE